MYARRTTKPIESAIAFTIFGIIGLCIVLFFLIGNIRVYCYGTTVEGVVVASDESIDEDKGGKIYYINSADYVVNDKKYRFNAFSKTKYSMLGQTVVVHYNPNDPSEACTSIWGYGNILPQILLLSIILFVAAAYFFWEARRE